MFNSICTLSESNISYFLGIFLLIYSVLGVNISIMGVNLPKIDSARKVISLSLIGIAMIFVSFANDNGIIELPHFLNKKQSIHIEKPMYGEYRVDNCITFGNDCGTIAAIKYCNDVERFQATSVNFDIDLNIGKDGTKTINLGNNNICSQDFCAGFKYITCNK